MVIHAFPGPAGINDQEQGGMFPTRGDVATHNTFHVAAWAGDTPVPEDPNACRAASADRLVQSLAPFLIVATERVFFGYDTPQTSQPTTCRRKPQDSLFT